MLPIDSKLEHKEIRFKDMQQYAGEAQFVLSGNWDYHNGFFDRSLDSTHKVWIRIPFQSIEGVIDSETTDNDSSIKLGQPFLLRHLYREGNDPDSNVGVISASFNQFQSPANPDAEIDPKWVQEGEKALTELEDRLEHII